MQIGDRRPDFDDPLGLMASCHRRVERFLDLLVAVAQGPGALDPSRRTALATALDYFQVSGARHTQDEEQSLHPRLRRLSDPAMASLMARVDALERDHQHAELLHGRIEQTGRSWLDAGRLGAGPLAALQADLSALGELYPPHIAFEDRVLYPAARQALSAADIAAIGLELAARRGVDLAARSALLG